MAEPAPPPGFDIGLCNRLLVEAAGVGLALVDPASLEIVFHNRRFAEWFPAAEPGERPALPDVLGEFPVAQVRAALDERGTQTVERTVRVRRRPVSLIIRLYAEEQNGRVFWVVECQNNSKVKELEALIES